MDRNKFIPETPELAYHQFRARFTQESQTVLKALGMNNIEWRIALPAVPPNGHHITHPTTLLDLKRFAKRESNPNFMKNGQNGLHLKVELFLWSNWDQIIDYMAPSDHAPFVQPFCFPEVKDIDNLGTDGHGRAYVVEIGTRGKQQQLERQVDAVQTLYPELPVQGILAYYEFNRRQDGGTIIMTTPQ